MSLPSNPVPLGITLIGMPASGKSTVSKILARRLEWPLVDVDTWLAEHSGFPSVGDLIRAKGADHALALEERYIRGIDVRGHVLSPPGSVIYTGCGPQLRAESLVVFLDVPLKVLAGRLARDPNNRRGVIGLEAGGLTDLFNERAPLYRQLAEVTLVPGEQTAPELADAVLDLYTAHVKNRL